MGQALFGRWSPRAQCAPRSRFSAILAGKILGLGLFALATGSAAEAQTLAAVPNGRPIDHIGIARPVLGWVKFCERNPDECRVDVSEPAVVTLTPQVWR